MNPAPPVMRILPGTRREVSAADAFLDLRPVCPARVGCMTLGIGWRDREYARWTDEERRRFLGTPGGTARSRSSRRGRTCAQGAGWAVGLSVVLVALGYLPRGHPILPALHFRIPASRHSAAAPKPVRLHGPRTVRRGSFLTFHGRVPSGHEGAVVIRGSLDGGAWRTLAIADGNDGAYRARIALRRRGMLRLHVLFRGGIVEVGSVRVI
jgi:hypothetical protein